MHDYRTIEIAKLLPSCLITIKIMLLNTVKKSMKGPEKSFLVNQKFMSGYKEVKIGKKSFLVNQTFM